jgi:hypothetical protein
MRQILLNALFNSQNQQAAMLSAQTQAQAAKAQQQTQEEGAADE